MRYLVSTLFMLTISVSLLAQAPITYHDVGVIINTNSETSVTIGEYFAAQRNIPDANLIYINVPAKETINGTEFADARQQIEDYLTTSGLADSLNYLVTTKGVPLRVNLGKLPSVGTASASFDAELMLILGPFANHIMDSTLVTPQGGIRTHPYWGRDEQYSRQSYGMYLVTRLTALTEERVIELIDRQGPNTYVDKDSAQFILDIDPDNNFPGRQQYNDNMIEAKNALVSRGWNVLLDETTEYQADHRNVIGYVSWGSNDHYDHLNTTKSRPRNHWLRGSIAETYVSTGGRNFTPGQESGQSRIADLIEEGCAGVSGYVFEPYTVALAWVNILFPRYVDGHYLADAYYMSLPTMSWMAIVVGDPKATIITEYPEFPQPVFESPIVACKDDILDLLPTDLAEGNVYWYDADSATVKAAGPPFDWRHPNFLQSGNLYSAPTDMPGSYVYSVRNENISGAAFAQANVTITEQLIPDVSVSADTVYLDESGEVSFTDNTPGAISWQWDFGDGNSSSEQNPTHTFASAGLYQVRLTVSNLGCSKIEIMPITVLENRPVVELSDTDVDFGTVQISTEGSFELKVYNHYPSPVFVSAIILQGVGASDFSYEAPSPPFGIPGGSVQYIDLKFAPTAEGLRTAELLITHDKSPDPETVSLRGTGSADPNAIIDPAYVPVGVELHQNYPNPFNPATRIEYALPNAAHVQLAVYNALGDEVAVLVNQTEQAGLHRVEWNAAAYPSGLYFYRLTVDGSSLSRSMHLVK
ncbi:MAG: hypothetical protein CL946_03240 [Ectothiorhodospiraceae bacterium]|nr:hypothetical protein [Ectothiorhodospiraceae bacterium]